MTPLQLSMRAGTLAALDATPDGTPVGTALLVPGYTGSKEDFALILDPLAEAGYRVVAIDLPGQYQSPGPPERSAYTVAWLGEVVNEVAEALGPVHLLGHSLGGLVARAAVLAAPRRYRSLILLCSGPAGVADESRRRRLARLESVAHLGMPALYDAMAAESGGSPAPEPIEAFLRERFLASSPAGLLGMGAALLTEPDLVDDLHATGVPTLVCFGENDEPWPPPVQREMARRLGAPVEVIADAAHSPAMERPDETARVLAGFWKRY